MTVTDAGMIKLADQWGKIKFLKGTDDGNVMFGIDLEGTLDALVSMVEQFKDEPEDLKDALAGFVLVMSTLGMKRVLQLNGMAGSEANKMLLEVLEEEFNLHTIPDDVMNASLPDAT